MNETLNYRFSVDGDSFIRSVRSFHPSRYYHYTLCVFVFLSNSLSLSLYFSVVHTVSCVRVCDNNGPNERKKSTNLSENACLHRHHCAGNGWNWNAETRRTSCCHLVRFAFIFCGQIGILVLLLSGTCMHGHAFNSQNTFVSANRQLRIERLSFASPSAIRGVLEHMYRLYVRCDVVLSHDSFAIAFVLYYKNYIVKFCVSRNERIQLNVCIVLCVCMSANVHTHAAGCPCSIWVCEILWNR